MKFLRFIRLLFVSFIVVFSTTTALFFAIVDRSLKSYYWYDKIAVFLMIYFSKMKLTVSGLENIDTSKAYVFVSNHQSMFDIPVLQYLIPVKTRLVFKKELAYIPFFGWQLLLGPYVVMDRNNPEKAMKSIQKAKKIMETKKESVLLFAEGTRTTDGSVLPFKRGAFYLAARVNHDIVPVSITGTGEILPKGKFTLNYGEVHVHFAPPVSATNIKGKLAEVELMNNVRDIVIANKRR